MTIDNTDNVVDRVASQGPQVAQAGVSSVGFEDITGKFPAFSYWYASSVNQASYGAEVISLSNGGASLDASFSLGQVTESVYPYNNVKMTQSGHAFELNDTVGNERILLRHKSGAGVEIQPDGTIVISTPDKHVVSVGADMSVVVEGDTTIEYKGNVSMKVAGDYNVEVAGNYNIDVGGNLFDTVDGNKRSNVEGSIGTTIKGNESRTIIGASTTSVFGNSTQVTKGEHKTTSQGLYKVTAGDRAHLSARNTMDISSLSVNMAAQNLSVLGAEGTIGGENIIMYNYNSYSGHTVYAGETLSAPVGNVTRLNGTSAHYSTFHGDLNGTAVGAERAGTAAAGPAHGGSASISSASNLSDDATETAEANSSNMAALLNGSSKGAAIVEIDPGGTLVNLIKQSSNTGGITNRPLQSTEVRSKLRDPGNRSNTTFIQSQIAAGVLNAGYANPIPPGIGRVTTGDERPVRGSQRFGNNATSNSIGRFETSKSTIRFAPEPRFAIKDDTRVTAGTMLAQGVSISRFLGGEGDKTNLNHIPDLSTRRQIARNLQPQAELIRSITTNNGDFRDFRLRVVEGLYKPGPFETPTTDSINDLASQGRVVVYELLDRNGNVDEEMTYELAIHWNDFEPFDKLILDYDNYAPDGSLNAQIIVIMPEQNTLYNSTFKNEVETQYNNSIVSSNELIEVLASES